MSPQLHGALICAAISGGALAIVAFGCAVAYMCGAVIDRHTDQHIDRALDSFGIDTEAAIAQALAAVTDAPIDDHRLGQAVAAFDNAQRGQFVTSSAPSLDELAQRRQRRRTVAR